MELRTAVSVSGSTAYQRASEEVVAFTHYRGVSGDSCAKVGTDRPTCILCVKKLQDVNSRTSDT